MDTLKSFSNFIDNLRGSPFKPDLNKHFIQLKLLIFLFVNGFTNPSSSDFSKEKMIYKMPPPHMDLKSFISEEKARIDKCKYSTYAPSELLAVLIEIIVPDSSGRDPWNLFLTETLNLSPEGNRRVFTFKINYIRKDVEKSSYTTKPMIFEGNVVSLYGDSHVESAEEPLGNKKENSEIQVLTLNGNIVKHSDDKGLYLEVLKILEADDLKTELQKEEYKQGVVIGNKLVKFLYVRVVPPSNCYQEFLRREHHRRRRLFNLSFI